MDKCQSCTKNLIVNKISMLQAFKVSIKRGRSKKWTNTLNLASWGYFFERWGIIPGKRFRFLPDEKSGKRLTSAFARWFCRVPLGGSIYSNVTPPLGREQYCGVSKGGEHPLWSRARFKPRPRSGFVYFDGPSAASISTRVSKTSNSPRWG